MFVLIGAFFAILIRAIEGRRLGYIKHPGYRFVGVSALLGAVVGTKLGMIFYIEPARYPDLWAAMLDLRFDGKTVLGGITGGYIGTEIGKKLAGVKFSTGDAFAVALPVAQGFGRIGCFLNGCCWGTESNARWAVHSHDALRHPVQLYETGLVWLLAAFLFSIRKRPRTAGHLFRYYLIGYALIRFSLEFVRAEEQMRVGPLSYAQVYCLLVAAGFAWTVRPRSTRPEPTQ